MFSHCVHFARYSTFNSNTVYSISRQSLRQANTDFYLAYGDGKKAEDEQESTHLGKIKFLWWSFLRNKQPQRHISDSSSS